MAEQDNDSLSFSQSLVENLSIDNMIPRQGWKAAQEVDCIPAHGPVQAPRNALLLAMRPEIHKLHVLPDHVPINPGVVKAKPEEALRPSWRGNGGGPTAGSGRPGARRIRQCGRGV